MVKRKPILTIYYRVRNGQTQVNTGGQIWSNFTGFRQPVPKETIRKYFSTHNKNFSVRVYKKK